MKTTMRQIRTAKRMAAKADSYAMRCVVYVVLCMAAVLDAIVGFLKDTTSGKIFLSSWALAALVGVAAALGYSEGAGTGLFFVVLTNLAGIVILLEEIKEKY